MMQQRIDIMKDVPTGNLIIAVVTLKSQQRGERDVLLPVRAILVISVKWKALSWIAVKVEIRYVCNSQNGERLALVASDTQNDILCVTFREDFRKTVNLFIH